MKEAFEIARIIQKSLKGKLSESEEKLLSDWRKVSEENEHAFQRMISEDFYTVGMEKLETYDYRVAYGRFLQKKYQRRRKRRFLISMARVAAVALPFVMAVVLYVGLNREEEQTLRPSLASNILPGTSKAVLTLANGQMIPLGKETTDSTIITDGTQISASGSGITYADGGESEAVVYNKLDIPRGGEFCLTLSDGTRVWLNSETSIQYPVVFGTKERRVFIQGEAYFEVAKDAKKPFTVQFMSSSVTVLGTSFNIRAYPEEKQSQTTLAEGSVRIYSPGSSMLLKPGEQAEVKALSGEMVKKEVEVKTFTSWKDGRFVFEQEPLENIMRTLERWYDIRVIFRDEGAKRISLSGNLKRYGDFSQVMNMLQMTGDVRFELHGNDVYITTE
ncbi:FecR family protein [Butyricimonas faecalis]|uniref:FecR family protein n=1 Tax=Butyricimonas faecalis TaxID=2093856 RepID=A0A3S9VS88_9BACT|nr:FecR domain-containing protein [Butyricimonas faecalis]AZS29388.1 FecR family protein [Butyricimonas faecalis]